MYDGSAVSSQRPPSTSERLAGAALDAFSRAGFEGTSARQIERLAGVERGLVGYHFGSKQQLWNTAVDLLFDRYTNELEGLRDALRDVSKRERARAILMAYVRFNAKNPEFFRILIIEGHVKSERSERLAFHLRRAMSVFSDLTELSSAIPVQEAIRMFQIIGAAGTLFALSAHGEQTFGSKLHDAEFIDRFARSLAAIALNDSEPIGGESHPDNEVVEFLGWRPDGD